MSTAGHMISLCCTFEELPGWFPTCFYHFFHPNLQAKGFLISPHPCYSLSLWLYHSWEGWSGSVCLSRMVENLKQLIMRLLAICISALETWQSFSHLKAGIVFEPPNYNSLFSTTVPPVFCRPLLYRGTLFIMPPTFRFSPYFLDEINTSNTNSFDNNVFNSPVSVAGLLLTW